VQPALARQMNSDFISQQFDVAFPGAGGAVPTSPAPNSSTSQSLVKTDQ